MYCVLIQTLSLYLVSEQKKPLRNEPREDSDLAITTTKKKGGSSTINCPMLNKTNYTVWATQMKILLRIHEVWGVVEEESTEIKNNI